jgi:diguanylate cyclase (GGDEF)-like protein
MKILIVEDDEPVAKVLTIILNDQNHAVEVATDGEIAWNLIQSFNYDLVVLDVILPKMDGISLCRKIRAYGLKMPIILLTGQNRSDYKETGLDAGADDYVVKPFDTQELVARVRALLRRGNCSIMPVIEWGNLCLDPSSMKVYYETRPVSLTRKEYALLELFMRYPRQVFSCDTILEHAWSFENTPTEEAVRTQIKGLRNKLKAAGAAPDLIETVYGIGYRLKTLQPNVSESVDTETLGRQPQQTVEIFTLVWKRFQQRINQHLSLLEQFAADCLHNTLTEELRVQAQQEAHTLTSLLSNFGFSKSSQLACTIERYLQSSQCFGSREAHYLHKLVLALGKEMKRLPLARVTKPLTHRNEPSKLLIIDNDSQLAAELVKEAEIQGLHSQVATTMSEARDKIYSTRPNIVLLDPVVGNTTVEGLTLLAELIQQTPPVPVLVFTSDSSLDIRTEVARLGGSAFLQKPLPLDEVLRTVIHVLQPTIDTEAVVMVVDNNPQILTNVQTLLQAWGIKVITLNDPRRFWETLEASTPDLLIVDVKMSHFSGLQLCQVVRNDTYWGGLPILFFASPTDGTTIHQMLTVGADDFVSKPIVGFELVSRILKRLERIKLQKSLAEIDPLTRVYNRCQATQDLNKFLRLSQRHNQPLCLAILHLDNFRQVYNAFGHATGDVVLRQIGQLLQQSFRREDIVARWGRDEFVVGIYGITRSDSLKRLIQVVDILHNQEFIATNNSRFRVKFSAGVAQYPEDGTNLESLYQCAHRFLEKAETAGSEHLLSGSCISAG